MQRNSTFAALLLATVATSGCRWHDDDDRTTGQAAQPIQAPPPPQPIAIPAGAIVKGKSIGPLPLTSGAGEDGAMIASLPIDQPPTFFASPISLVYSSRSGNGVIGRGWELSAGQSSIVRCQKTIATDGWSAGIHYDGNDSLCLDGKKLIPVPGVPNQYQTEEWSDLKIEALAADPYGPTSFKVTDGDGTVTTYAQRLTPMHYEIDGDAPPQVYQKTVASRWLVSERKDRQGNAERYSYQILAHGPTPNDPPTAEYGSEVLLDKIDYVGAGQPVGRRYMKFVYDTRSDVSFLHHAGVRTDSTHLLKKIEAHAPNPPDPAQGPMVWHYDLDYSGPQPALHRALLGSVVKCGALGGCSTPKTFSYDAKGPILTAQSSVELRIPLTMEDPEAPKNMAFEGITVADLNGDGVDQILVDYTEVVCKPKPNLGVECKPGMRHFEPIGGADVELSPSIQPLSAFDVEADGKAEIMAIDASNHYGFLVRSGSTWTEKYVLPYTINDLSGIHMLDVDGDGRSDLAGTYGGAFTWFLNHGDGTFGQPISTNIAAGPNCGAGKADGHGVDVMDTDGDGRQELAISVYIQATGLCDRQAIGMAPNGATEQKAAFVQRGDQELLDPKDPVQYAWTAGDWNGDGLADLLYVHATNGFADPAKISWNIGGSFTRPAVVTDPGLTDLLRNSVPVGFLNDPPGVRTDRTIDVDDWNGDGRDDLLITTRDGNLPPGDEWIHTLFLSRGDGTFEQSGSVFQWGPKIQGIVAGGDFDGDGRRDLMVTPAIDPADCAWDECTAWYLAFGNDTAEPDRLNEVRDGNAARPEVQVVYGRTTPSDANTSTCNYPIECVMHAMPVVQSLWGLDHPAGEYYRFEDPRFDRKGRGFLGFQAVRTWAPRSLTEKTTTYDLAAMHGTQYIHQGRPNQIKTVQAIVDDPQVDTIIGGILKGDLVTRPPALSGLARVTQEDYAYTTAPAGRAEAGDDAFHVAVDHVTTHTWDTQSPVTIDDTPNLRVHITGVQSWTNPVIETTTSYGYDQWLNATSVVTDTTNGLHREVLSTPEVRPNQWLLHLPQVRKERAWKLGQQPPPEVVTTYHHTADGKALLDSVAVDVDGDPDQQSTKQLFYGPTNQIVGVSTWAPNVPVRWKHFVYNDVTNEGLFRTQTYDDLGQSSWTVMHPALGVPVVTMNQRGDVATATYDDLGRSMTTTPAVGPVVTYGRDQVLDGSGHVVGWKIATTDSDGAASTLIYDDRGQAIERDRLGFDGTTVVDKVVYRADGHVAATIDPASNQTDVMSDSLGRLRMVKPPGGVATWQVYTLLTRTVNDPMSRSRTTTIDYDGRVATVKEGDPANPVFTNYVNDSAAGPTDIIDSQNHHVTHAYDGLGRSIEGDDPDTGHGWTFYNGLGEVRATRRGTEMTSYDRDAYGRVSAVRHSDGTVTTTDWDSAQGGLGLVASTTSPDGVVMSYGYDVHGRMTSETMSLDKDDYAIGIQYDPSGRLAQVDYPAVPGRQPMSARYTYRTGGFLDKIESSDPAAANAWRPLWTPVSYDPRGGLAEAIYGRGTDASNDYDPITGELAATRVTTDGGVTALALGYTYWSDGRIHTKTDLSLPGTRTESFSNDWFGRLSLWQVSAPGSFHTTQYAYDDLGNLIDITRDNAVIEHRVFGQNAGPHALTTRQFGMAGSTTYQYDVAGRLVSSSDGLGLSSFAPSDLPRRVVRGGTDTFAYDGMGRRVRKTANGTDVTITFAGMFEKRTAGGAASDVFHVVGPSGPVAQIMWDEAATAETELYPQTDRLGSIAAVIDDAGHVVSRPRFDPFGGQVDVNGNPTGAGLVGAIRRGFTGQDHDDDVGLVNMKGRLYDPAMKTFASADPFVVHPYSGQSYNPYSYVENDPTNAIDPSGYRMKADIHVMCYGLIGVGAFCIGDGGAGNDVTNEDQGEDMRLAQNDTEAPPDEKVIRTDGGDSQFAPPGPDGATNAGDAGVNNASSEPGPSSSQPPAAASVCPVRPVPTGIRTPNLNTAVRFLKKWEAVTGSRNPLWLTILRKAAYRDGTLSPGLVTIGPNGAVTEAEKHGAQVFFMPDDYYNESINGAWLQGAIDARRSISVVRSDLSCGLPEHEGNVFRKEVSTVNSFGNDRHPDFGKYPTLPGTHNPPSTTYEGTGHQGP